MKKIFGFSIAVFAFLVFSVFASNAQTISGSIGNGTVVRGSGTRAAIVMNIPVGLHVNSSRPVSAYAIPTSVRVSGSGVKVSAVNYPRGKNKKFPFSESLINVYDGRVSFPFTVTVPANFRGNTVRVQATVRYQPCTDEVCYPPRTKEITLTAKVR